MLIVQTPSLRNLKNTQLCNLYSAYMQTLTHLYLSGGGLSGLSYMGVYRALVQSGHMGSVMHFGGVSIGALFSALFAMNLDVDELQTYIKHFFSQKTSTVIHVSNPMDIWSQFGYGDCHEFISKPILHFLSAKYGYMRPTISFLEFAKLTGRTLTVTATNLATQRTRVFSVDDSPNVCVIDAVCASACVPFLFRPVLIDGEQYTDGGVSSELPPLPFDETHENSSLAIFLLQQVETQVNPPTFFAFLQSTVQSIFTNLRSMRFYKNKLILDENPIEFLPLHFSKTALNIMVQPHQIDDAFHYGYRKMYNYITEQTKPS